MSPKETVLESIRFVERQKQARGQASAEAWRSLELSLIRLDQPLAPTVAQRLDRVIHE